MAKYFLDSSALTKRYKYETGTEFVNSLFNGNHQLFYLNLAIIEVVRVFYRLRYHPQTLEGDIKITDEGFQFVQNQLAADLQQMQRVVLTEEMISYVGVILQNCLLKAFDLAHLSAFLITRQEHPDIVLVAADESLCEATKRFIPATNVVNPEEYCAALGKN